jgi:hypothetical protein
MTVMCVGRTNWGLTRSPEAGGNGTRPDSAETRVSVMRGTLGQKRSSSPGSERGMMDFKREPLAGGVADGSCA